MKSARALVLMVALLWTHSRGLRVIPDRSEFWRWDSVELECENPDWTVRRTTLRDKGSGCGQGWGQLQRDTCSFRYIDPMDSGWYWCESADGRSAGGRNITVSGKPLRPRLGATNRPPAPGTTPPAARTPPPAPQTPAPQRPLAVAVLCHLLVLCPYVMSTLILISLHRQRSSGNRDLPVAAVMAQTEAAMGLDRPADDTTEHHF